MVQITGKYEFVKNVGMAEYLRAMNIPEDAIKATLDDKPTIEVTLNGNSVKLVTTGFGGKTAEYELNKPTEEVMLAIPVTTVVTLNDATLQVTSTAKDGSTFVRTHVFSDTGFVVTLSGSKAGNVTASRHCKRV